MSYQRTILLGETPIEIQLNFFILYYQNVKDYADLNLQKVSLFEIMQAIFSMSNLLFFSISVYRSKLKLYFYNGSSLNTYLLKARLF